MKIHTAIVALLIISVHGSAQTSTTYYDRNGVPVGSAKTEKTWTPQPYQGSTFQYQSTLPSLNLIENGLAHKQGQTDSRKAAIQMMIDGIAADINILFGAYPTQGRDLYKGLNDLIASLNSVQQDITQDRVYNPMVGKVNDFKSKVNSTYRTASATASSSTSSAGLSSFLEYKIGNAPTFVGMNKTRVEGLLSNRSN